MSNVDNFVLKHEDWTQKTKLSWIFKSFSDATDTTYATARAAYKAWAYKPSSRNAKENSRGSLALLNDCCHRAGVCFPSVY